MNILVQKKKKQNRRNKKVEHQNYRFNRTQQFGCNFGEKFIGNWIIISDPFAYIHKMECVEIIATIVFFVTSRHHNVHLETGDSDGHRPSREEIKKKHRNGTQRMTIFFFFRSHCTKEKLSHLQAIFA